MSDVTSTAYVTPSLSSADYSMCGGHKEEANFDVLSHLGFKYVSPTNML